MNVLYTCDNNYVWLMGISVISLFENNKHIEELTVYLLGEGITNASKNDLKLIAQRYNRNIIVINVPKLDIPQVLLSSRWPASAYIRLYSGQLLPIEINKILYLDCDTIVTGDISELDKVDFLEKIVYGVKDCISGTYKKNIGLDKESIYINAGVLLFDLQALREIDMNRKIEDYMNQYERLINYADQDILNGILKGKIGELNPKFDVMTISVVHSYEQIKILRNPTNYYEKKELTNASNEPRIIHYTTNMLIIRPWYLHSNHPFAHEFVKYMKMSPWKDKEFEEMKFVSKESKIISIFSVLPSFVSYRILGLIHAEIKPRVINLRSKWRKRG